MKSRFPYPITINVASQLVVVGLCRLWFGTRHDPRMLSTRTCFAIGGCTIISHILGFYPFAYMSMAFVHVMKAFAPVFVVIALAVFRVEIPDRRSVLYLSLICLSAAFVTSGDLRFSTAGLMYMVASSVVDTARLTLIQKQLSGTDPVHLFVHTSRAGMWVGVPLVVLELEGIARSEAISEAAMLTLINGTVGFAVNMVSMLVVDRLGSPSLKVINLVRNFGIVLASSFIEGTTLSARQYACYIAILVLFYMYTKTMRARASSIIPTTDRSQ